MIEYKLNIQCRKYTSYALLCIGVLLIFAGATSSCPFMQNGRLAQKMIEQKKAALIAADIRINEGDPTFVVWQMGPFNTEVQGAYNKSMVLLQAQQFQLDQWQRDHPSNFSRNKLDNLWQSFETAVPIDERRRVQPICDPKQKFVTVNGACNNLKIPLQGASYTPYSRLLGAFFDDGLYSMRKGVSKRNLPEPRDISNLVSTINVYNPPPSISLSYGSLLFGQFITHDMGFKDVYQDYSGGNGLRCCSKDFKKPLPEQFAYFGCKAMEAPADDAFYSKFGGGCIEYIRSQPVVSNTGKIGPAEFSNSVTHNMDQSNIYGSTAETHQPVRSYVKGQLKIDNGIMALLANCTGDFCYYTGDARGGVYPTLSLFHSTLIRFHNNIASCLSERKGHIWNDNRLFQETRRLVTAVYQHIVYDEWLPLYLGQAASLRRNLTSSPNRNGAHNGMYDPKVDASNMNEYGHAAFRVFHLNTPVNINMYDENYRLNETIPLDRSIHGAALLQTQYDGIMRGFFKDPILVGKYPDHMKNTVFGEGNKNHIGIDMVSVDLQRGLDHGLRTYVEYLAKCMPGKTVNSWMDLLGIFSFKSLQGMQKLYESWKDIDLYVGLLFEEKPDSLVGPVTRCIMEEQFYRSKYGDRFFYSLANNANPFTTAQLLEINRMGLANVFCTTSKIGMVPTRVFETIGPGNPLILCPKFMLNLDLLTDS